jgi:hypothetical protein
LLSNVFTPLERGDDDVTADASADVDADAATVENADINTDVTDDAAADDEGSAVSISSGERGGVTGMTHLRLPSENSITEAVLASPLHVLVDDAAHKGADAAAATADDDAVHDAQRLVEVEAEAAALLVAETRNDHGASSLPVRLKRSLASSPSLPSLTHALPRLPPFAVAGRAARAAAHTHSLTASSSSSPSSFDFDSSKPMPPAISRMYRDPPRGLRARDDDDIVIPVASCVRDLMSRLAPFSAGVRVQKPIVRRTQMHAARHMLTSHALY